MRLARGGVKLISRKRRADRPIRRFADERIRVHGSVMHEACVLPPSHRTATVQLRRRSRTKWGPEGHDLEEIRADPLCEFGSFGCTRCHSPSLMTPRTLHELSGSWLAFAEGGEGEFLLHVTPPVGTVNHGLL